MPKDSSAKDAAPANKTVLAAGAVLWRASDDGAEPEVAVVHRPRYDDWSLPKGKVDAGEHVLTAAVREIREEPGFEVVVGPRGPPTHYPVREGTKRVDYWMVRAVGGSFTPNDEVDELRWL